jgi:hypothetical protein
MIIKNKFEIGEIVFHKSGHDHCGVVTSILVREGGAIQYNVAWDDLEERAHDGCELSSEQYV